MTERKSRSGSGQIVGLNAPPTIRLKQFLSSGYENSVFRRTAVLIGFLVPASLANFAALYFMTSLLSPAEFGIFYVANTMGNVLFSGSLILNMFFARHLVTTRLAQGEEGAFAAVGLIGRAVIRWGALLGSGALVGMLLFSRNFGMQALSVIPLITLDAYTSYVADIGRAFFQSLRRTVWLGTYTLGWMTLRLILCVAGVFAFRTAFGALLGVVASTFLVCIAFRLWTKKRVNVTIESSPLPSLNALLPSILGYGLLITISNLDVLLSYLILKDGKLGVYSASSIFPKAMLLVTLPFLQILFPAMMGGKPSDPESRRVAVKSGIVMAVLASGGIVGIWLLSGSLCGGKWGVSLCDPSLLYPLLFSVLPLSLLRVLVLLQFARSRDWLVSWLILPTIVCLYAATAHRWNAYGMAIGFSVFSTASFVFFLCIHLAAERLSARARPYYSV